MPNVTPRSHQDRYWGENGPTTASVTLISFLLLSCVIYILHLQCYDATDSYDALIVIIL